MKIYLVKRILGVGFKEQVLEPVDNRVDGENRFPVLAQNIETNIAFKIYIRMVDLSLTLHLGENNNSFI